MIDDVTAEHLNQHWVPLGEFVAPEVAGFTHVELEPLVYSYWTSLFPDADSIDNLMDLTSDGLYDRYSIVASVTWSPQHMIGGTTSQLGFLTVGRHSFIAEPPDLHAQMGWLVHGEADNDPHNAIADFLLGLFGDSTPIPDQIAADVPADTIRKWLKAILDRHEPSDHFGWHALAEKVQSVSAERDEALDRYVAAHVWS